METIAIVYSISNMEISTRNRAELSRIVDYALHDFGCGRWAGCQYTKDTITIHALVDDEEKAWRVIRKAIKGHPVFSHMKTTLNRSDGNLRLPDFTTGDAVDDLMSLIQDLRNRLG